MDCLETARKEEVRMAELNIFVVLRTHEERREVKKMFFFWGKKNLFNLLKSSNDRPP